MSNRFHGFHPLPPLSWGSSKWSAKDKFVEKERTQSPIELIYLISLWIEGTGSFSLLDSCSLSSFEAESKNFLLDGFSCFAIKSIVCEKLPDTPPIHSLRYTFDFLSVNSQKPKT